MMLDGLDCVLMIGLMKDTMDGVTDGLVVDVSLLGNDCHSFWNKFLLRGH
jgi:hypothetical protein